MFEDSVMYVSRLWREKATAKAGAVYLICGVLMEALWYEKGKRGFSVCHCSPMHTGETVAFPCCGTEDGWDPLYYVSAGQTGFKSQAFQGYLYLLPLYLPRYLLRLLGTE